MTKIISILNHKGGVGKTTTTINLGDALNLKGKKILLIDADSQLNLTQSLGLNDVAGQNIYGALLEQYSLPIINLEKGLDVVPSSLDLASADLELSKDPGGVLILKELLDEVKERYDYILIDCPPSLGMISMSALVASNSLIVPIQSEYLAFRGVPALLKSYNKVKSRLNKDLEVLGYLITKYDNRQIIHRDIASEIQKVYGDSVFNTIIRMNVALTEATTSRQTIFEWNPKSFGAIDYNNLADEVLERIQQ